MRYSRIKKGRVKKNYAIWLILFILLFLGIYIVSAGAVGNYVSKSIVSIFNSMNKNQAKDSPNDLGEQKEDKQDTHLIVDKTQKDDTNGDKEQASGKTAQTQRITEQIKIEPLKVNAIQIGAFTSEENANEWARDLQSKGGAGYILNDKYFRVLAIGFKSEEDAKKVVEQLKKQNIESRIYEMSVPGANLQITAVSDKVSGMKMAFSLWVEKINELENIIKELDSDKISAETACAKIQMIKDQQNEQLQKIEGYLSAQQKENIILEGLAEVYKKGNKNFEDILKLKSGNRVALTSKIKYTYIDMVYIFQQYMNKIIKS